MSVQSKHIATFLLGAAAGIAAYKFASMTDEEKERMMADLKEKAKSFKEEAEGMADRAGEYFEELKQKGSRSFGEGMEGLSSIFDDLFGKREEGGKAV